MIFSSSSSREKLKASFDQMMDGYAEMGVISSSMYPDWFDLPEGKEGGAAFVEKRKPRFWEIREHEAEMRQRLLEEWERKK